MNPPSSRIALLKKNPPRLEALVGRNTLLLGETNSGKTRFTFNFLCHLLEQKLCDPSEISVLEFAPTRVQEGQISIGGTLREILHESKLLSSSFRRLMDSVHWVDHDANKFHPHTIPKILTPRYSARSAQEVLSACCANFAATQKQLLYFARNPTKVLLINDVGIYLHLGGLRLLKKTLAVSQTALVNAYYGTTLLKDWDSYISRREKIMLSLLSKFLDSYFCEHYPS